MTNSLFTLQSAPRPRREPRPGRCLAIFSERRVSPTHAPPAHDPGGGVPNGGGANGGGERDRTDDLLLAKQALSQLSYTPAPQDRDQASVIRAARAPDFGQCPNRVCHLF